MKAVQFAQVNVQVAENQPEYSTLPAHVGGGVVTSCWELDEREQGELASLMLSGRPLRIYLSQCTFGKAVQPVALGLTFNPPVLEGITVAPEPAPPAPAPVVNPTHLADVTGTSAPLLMAMDAQSLPGKTICHFVRFETHIMEEGEETEEMKAIAPGADKRLDFLSRLFRLGFEEEQKQSAKAIVQLFQIIELTKSTLEVVVKFTLNNQIKMPAKVFNSVQQCTAMLTRALQTK